MKKLSSVILADLVASKRKEKSMTQQALAEATGINRALISRIEKQDFILTPGRYVGIEEAEEDGEPFEEKMTRLTSELSEMFAKSHELEDEIRKKLGAIGYEI